MKTLSIICILSVFLAVSCQNPCAYTTCENGGLCVDGDCNCAEGFNGPSCAGENIPTLMVLKEVSVKDFPATISRNNGWDSNSGPDIYFVLKQGGETIFTPNTIFENAKIGTTYSFEQLSVDITKPESRYELIVFDSDTPDADELVGRVEFTPYRVGRAFPTTLTYSSGGVDLELKVSYQW